MAKTALINVRVFDGSKVCEPSTVVIDGALIGNPLDTAGAREIDAQGAVLLPGLMDAHIHLHGPENLFQLRNYGVTTAMDMATWPLDLVTSLRQKGEEGLTSILSAGVPATSPGSAHSHIPGFPKDGCLADAASAKGFVAQRVKDGSDYIKIIADVPGPDQETLNALVAEARAQGKKTIAHAVALRPTQMALEAGVDMTTHAPLDQALDEASIEKMIREKRVCIPTLTMMEGVARNRKLPPFCYEQAKMTVRKMYEAGVPVLAGTDANAAPGVPANVEHGSSLHHELELLTEAGLSTLDALRAATVLPAEHFGLIDRGVVETGRRADLVLVEGDPIVDIRATKAIRMVWCNGIEYIPGS